MKIFKIGAIALLLTLFSCEKEKTEPQDQKISELYELLDETGITYTDVEVVGESFIVEGDIEIPFSYLEEFKAEKNLKGADQYKYPGNYYVSQNNIKNVKVFIKSDVPEGWKKATIASLNAWNNISGSKINFSEVSSSASADIVVKKGYDANNNWVAKANPAWQGKPGRNITINTKYNYFSASKKKNTIVHELGHTIRFAHTNGKSNFCTPEHISGTRTTQHSKSVMYRYTHDWWGFTGDDKKAAQEVYPE